MWWIWLAIWSGGSSHCLAGWKLIRQINSRLMSHDLCTPKHEPCSSDWNLCVRILLVHPPIEAFILQPKHVAADSFPLVTPSPPRLLPGWSTGIGLLLRSADQQIHPKLVPGDAALLAAWPNRPRAKNQIPLFLLDLSCSGSRLGTRDRSLLLPGSPCGPLSPAHVGLCAPVPTPERGDSQNKLEPYIWVPLFTMIRRQQHTMKFQQNSNLVQAEQSQWRQIHI